MATPNETDHTIKKYTTLLNGYNFKILDICSSFSVNKNCPLNSLMGNAKNILYRAFRFITPNYISSGNDIIILAKSRKIK